MHDLISRQAAIDAICKDWCNTTYKDCKALKAVPSADRPKDGDLISRTEAIEALGEEPPVWCDEEYEIAERNQWREDVEAIKSVPSADRPRGEWINTAPSDRSDNIICDQCGYNSIARYDYCPHCGADMRGEDE